MFRTEEPMPALVPYKSEKLLISRVVSQMDEVAGLKGMQNPIFFVIRSIFVLEE